MAKMTQHLEFGVTGAATYEPPLSFARGVSGDRSCDEGRVQVECRDRPMWTARRAHLERRGQLPHDECYGLAKEFIELVYKLWDGSWETMQ